MGGVFSSEPVPPWRTFKESYQDNLEYLKAYKPRNTKVTNLRILLHGPIGGGKSCFINSVDNIFQNRITTRALTNTTAGRTFTEKFKTFKIRKDKESFCSFVFHDIMGLEESANGGIHAEDLKVVLKGHVRKDFKFRPEHRITETDPGYNPTPTLEDRVHVLVSVIPSDKIPLMGNPIYNKIKDVRQAASDTGIPQLVIITKVDQACPKTQLDINNAYKSKQFEEQVKYLSETVGIPPNFIFLVKNYHSEIQTDPDMNALILSAVRRMVEVGEDFLDDQEDDKDLL